MIPISKNINIGKINQEKFELLKSFANNNTRWGFIMGEDWLETYLFINIEFGFFNTKDIIYSRNENNFFIYLYPIDDLISPRSLSITENAWTLLGKVNTDIDIDGITNNNIEQTKFQIMINRGIDIDSLEWMDKDDFVDKIIDVAIEKCKK